MLTFAAYSGIQFRSNDPLTVSKAFTSLTIFGLLSTPIALLLATLASIASAVASFGRIQDYLNGKEHGESTLPDRDPTLVGQETGDRHDQSKPSAKVGLQQMSPPLTAVSTTWFSASSNVNSQEVAAIQGTVTLAGASEPTIHIESWVIRRHTMNLILGPVGCGKTMLIKTLLRETSGFAGVVNGPCMDVAYCDQSPWLPNETISHIILGTSDFEVNWYKTVLEACALDEDIRLWPDGDAALVGSKGISLSGGQKQRLAIARALYSRRPFVIFDGVLDGLDAKTEAKVFDKLFSPAGILRHLGATVIVASSDAHRASFADYIIVMDRRGRIAHRGDYEHIKAQSDLAAILGQPSEGDVIGHIAQASTGASLSDEQAHLNRSRLPIVEDLELTRRVGDLTVYRYYAKSAGAITAAIYVLSMVGFGFCEAFPSKS